MNARKPAFVERRNDLGSARLVRQIRLPMVGVAIGGTALIGFCPITSLRILGALLDGFAAALLAGPSLALWTDGGDAVQGRRSLLIKTGRQDEDETA